MGKYMRKARGGRGVMELITQGPSGVRTRARSQAMERNRVKGNNSNAKLGYGTSMEGLVPAQISYLELRSRRLEKVASLVYNVLPAIQKTTSVDERRRLSDFTNSDILAGDTSSRLALSLDENHFIQLCHYGDNEAGDESSAQGSLRRSLHHWTSRGRAQPGVAHSRSNSRSNSVTREFPSLTRELLPHGILTRNQRKLGNQASGANACSSKAANLNVQKEIGALRSPNAGSFVESFDVEISLGENLPDIVWSAANRRIQEETQSSGTKEYNILSHVENIKPSRSACGWLTPPSITQPPLEMEIEDFLLNAEQQLHRHFRDRYNFDPQNETPLRGRYDWVKL